MAMHDDRTSFDDEPMRSPRIWLAEHLLHIGWAIHGQECDCSYNRFNWMARLSGEGNWTDAMEPADRWTSLKFRVGEAFVRAHERLMDGGQGRRNK